MIRERVIDGERILTVDTMEEFAEALTWGDVTIEAPPGMPEAFGLFPEDVGSQEEIDAAREDPHDSLSATADERKGQGPVRVHRRA